MSWWKYFMHIDLKVYVHTWVCMLTKLKNKVTLFLIK